MKNHSHTQKVSGARALLFAATTLFFTATAGAQITFTANGLAGEVHGASSSVSAVGLLYNNFGPVSGGITGVTFGNSFDLLATGPDAGNYDNTFIIGGTITGGSISAGTTITIAYDFTLAKNAFVTSDVVWSVKFSDAVNNPGNSVTGAALVASGTLSTASASFSGSGTYSFTTGVSAGTNFRLFVEATHTGALGIMPPEVTGTMNDTGYGGEGFTIGAVPEPSTYALFAALGALGWAVWRRRNRGGAIARAA